MAEIWQINDYPGHENAHLMLPVADLQILEQIVGHCEETGVWPVRSEDLDAAYELCEVVHTALMRAREAQTANMAGTARGIPENDPVPAEEENPDA